MSRPDTNGPIILWENYGCEGWGPRSFDTLKEALLAHRYQQDFVITALVDVEVKALRQNEDQAREAAAAEADFVSRASGFIKAHADLAVGLLPEQQIERYIKCAQSIYVSLVRGTTERIVADLTPEMSLKRLASIDF